MQKEDVWAAYTKRNPGFQTGSVSFTSNGIRKFFDQTWDLAYKQGLEDGSQLSKPTSPIIGDESVADFLKGLFDGTKQPQRP